MILTTTTTTRATPRKTFIAGSGLTRGTRTRWSIATWIKTARKNTGTGGTSTAITITIVTTTMITIGTRSRSCIKKMGGPRLAALGFEDAEILGSKNQASCD